MTMTDPLGDMLTRIRNGVSRRKSSVNTPASRLRARVLDVLQAEGYIRGYSEVSENGKTELQIELKYYEGASVIREIGRVSKPGRRVYVSVKSIPQVANGLGNTSRVGLRIREVVRRLRRSAQLRIIMHAVIGTLELDDLLAAGEAARQTDGVEGRIRTGSGKADTLGAADVGRRAPGQLDGRLVQIGEKVRAACRLIGNGIADLLVRMPDEHRAGTEHIVDILVTADIPEARPVAMAEYEARAFRQRIAAERTAGEQALGVAQLARFIRGEIAMPPERLRGRVLNRNIHAVRLEHLALPKFENTVFNIPLKPARQADKRRNLALALRDVKYIA